MSWLWQWFHEYMHISKRTRLHTYNSCSLLVCQLHLKRVFNKWRPLPSRTTGYHHYQQVDYTLCPSKGTLLSHCWHKERTTLWKLALAHDVAMKFPWRQFNCKRWCLSQTKEQRLIFKTFSATRCTLHCTFFPTLLTIDSQLFSG